MRAELETALLVVLKEWSEARIGAAAAAQRLDAAEHDLLELARMALTENALAASMGSRGNAAPTAAPTGELAGQEAGAVGMRVTMPVVPSASSIGDGGAEDASEIVLRQMRGESDDDDPSTIVLRQMREGYER